MNKPHKKSAGAGRKGDGNVVLDLGEKHSQKIQKMIDSKFAQAGLAGDSQRTEVGRPPFGLRPGSRFGGRFLGRPALGRPALGRPSAGYRPWFAGRRPWMGQEGALAITPRGLFDVIPTSIRQIATSELLTGFGLGILGNRALLRVTPNLWAGNTNPLMHQAIAFAAGLIPLLFKRNAMTLGVALPGAVFVGGTLVDMLFDALNMPKGLVSSDGKRIAGQDAALAARQKLAAIQQRMQAPAGQPRQVPRVVAQQYA
jgi:hypothetical protein